MRGGKARAARRRSAHPALSEQLRRQANVPAANLQPPVGQHLGGRAIPLDFTFDNPKLALPLD
jgi:hypothetical protein